MLKNPRVLDTFLHANQMSVYLRQNGKFSPVQFAAIFLLNNVLLGRCQARTLDGSYRLQSFTFYSQLSRRLTIFGLQKQALCSWWLIYENYYPRYNLAGKSNSTFSSKIIASMELLIDNWHITYH